MFCSHCGAENPEESRFCSSCGLALQDPQHPSAQPPAPPNQQPYYGPVSSIDNNLVWAILATICCCTPTGVVAIVFAAQVNGRLEQGDVVGAQSAAKSARNWVIVSAGLGVLSWIGGVIFFALIAFAG